MSREPGWPRYHRFFGRDIDSDVDDERAHLKAAGSRLTSCAVSRAKLASERHANGSAISPASKKR